MASSWLLYSTSAIPDFKVASKFTEERYKTEHNRWLALLETSIKQKNDLAARDLNEKITWCTSTYNEIQKELATQARRATAEAAGNKKN